MAYRVYTILRCCNISYSSRKYIIVRTRNVPKKQVSPVNSVKPSPGTAVGYTTWNIMCQEMCLFSGEKKNTSDRQINHVQIDHQQM